MIAWLEAERVKSGNDGANAPIPLRVAQAQRAIGNRQRIRIARDAADEALAEIKHTRWRPAKGTSEKRLHDKALAGDDKSVIGA
jgi:hypothetical protein